MGRVAAWLERSITSASATSSLRFRLAGWCAAAPERDRYRIEWVLPGVVVLDRQGRVVARDFGTEGVLRQRALLDSLSRS